MRKKKLINKLVFKDAAVATFITFFLSFFISTISFKQEFLKPFKQEFGDFDIYDLVYSSKNKQSFKRDPRIVLISYADSLGQIARQVELIKSAGPRVIAIDASFESKKDTAGIKQLKKTLSNINNLIIGSRLIYDRGSKKISITRGIMEGAVKSENFGYINLLGDEVSVIRNFTPSMRVAGTRELAFAAAISLKYDAGITKKYLERKNKVEVIDYSGGQNYFTTIAGEDLSYYLLEGQLGNMLKDKIVILGYFTLKGPLVMNDIHYTPLNERFAGRSWPDNYGIVIQANIISMILDGRHKKLGSNALSFFLAALFCFLHQLIHFRSVSRSKHPKHWKYLITTVLFLLLVTFIFLLVFKYLHVKIPLLPIIISLILSIELIPLYRAIAKYLAKHHNYKTLIKTEPT